jgi:RNA polymerase sigma factor (sigma-70 family)
MSSPFKERIDKADDDRLLIGRILDGSREDLETLIYRHQAWIYNIALKMVADPSDAEDITQEILIKIITKLSGYDPAKGAMRTWLYRIVTNHIINMKQRKYELDHLSFDDHAKAIERIADNAMHGQADNRVLIEEVKIKCWTGMLLCLDRRHRLVFILGDIFDVKDTVGSEILQISPLNYRRMLSRGRHRIYSFMTLKCGLLAAENPCHCGRKMEGFIKAGFADEDRIEFFNDDLKKIKEVIHQHQNDFNRLCSPETLQQFREHPFYEAPLAIQQWLKNTFAGESFGSLIAPD